MSRVDMARDYGIEDRKFSYALNIMASKIIDEAGREFRDRLGSHKYEKGLEAEKSVEDFIAESAIVVAGRITERAMQKLGRTATVPPHETLPEDYDMVMAFNLLVLHVIIAYATSEDFEIKASDWSGPSLYFFYNFRPREEMEILIKRDLDAYVYVVENSSAGIRKWHDALTTIVHGFISDSIERKYIDNEETVFEAFGELLKTLLLAADKK